MASRLDFFGMFDFEEGDDATYEYDSTEWSKLIKAITSNGVITGSFEMVASGLDITVSAGTGVIEGRYGYNINETVISLNPTTVVPRIDRIVLQLDVENRKIELAVSEGTPAASPTAPSLVQEENFYQIPLYQATVSTTGNVTLSDERIITFNPTEIMTKFNEIQAEFNEIKNGETTVYAVYA